MTSKLSIACASKLAGVTRQTIYNKIDKGELSKSNGGIDLSELLRIYPDLKIPDNEIDKDLDFNSQKIGDSLQHKVNLLEMENKHLKQRILDLEKHLTQAEEDKADLKAILKQQTAMLPNPNKINWWPFKK